MRVPRGAEYDLASIYWKADRAKAIVRLCSCSRLASGPFTLDGINGWVGVVAGAEAPTGCVGVAAGVDVLTVGAPVVGVVDGEDGLVDDVASALPDGDVERSRRGDGLICHYAN